MHAPAKTQRAEKIKQDIVKADIVGLCATCNNSSFCVYRSRRGFDAVYCEMFDYYSPNGHRDKNSDVIVTAQKVATKKKTPAKLKGLCENCEHRETCVLPKPEGGVWHCEEYS